MADNECPWCESVVDEGDLHDDLRGTYCDTCVTEWAAQYPDWSCACPRCESDHDKDLGICEFCGDFHDWEALHSATPGVYCDDCANADGWDCDCEECVDGREAVAAEPGAPLGGLGGS
jgi:hypothetical protein